MQVFICAAFWLLGKGNYGCSFFLANIIIQIADFALKEFENSYNFINLEICHISYFNSIIN